jgi:hypothetical protein
MPQLAKRKTPADGMCESRRGPVVVEVSVLTVLLEACQAGRQSVHGGVTGRFLDHELRGERGGASMTESDNLMRTKTTEKPSWLSPSPNVLGSKSAYGR